MLSSTITKKIEIFSDIEGLRQFCLFVCVCFCIAYVVTEGHEASKSKKKSQTIGPEWTQVTTHFFPFLSKKHKASA